MQHMDPQRIKVFFFVGGGQVQRGKMAEPGEGGGKGDSGRDKHGRGLAVGMALWQTSQYAKL